VRERSSPIIDVRRDAQTQSAFLAFESSSKAGLGCGVVQDNDLAAREKITGRMLVLDERLRDALAPTFEFLGVPDPEHRAPRLEPDAGQRQLFIHREAGGRGP
jgi:hypothetical protein